MPGGGLNRRQALTAAAALGLGAAGLAVWSRAAPPFRAPPAEPPLVGWLAPGREAEDVGHAAFSEGLRELSLIEGQTIRVAWRIADGQPERLAGLVAELLALRVRVLVAAGNTPTQAARAATDQVPIVSVNGADPVAQGFAASLARPGGNVTGIGGSPSDALYAKTAELLSDVVPTARRLGYLGNLAGGGSPHEAVANVAAQRGLEVLLADVPAFAEIEPAFELVRSGGAQLLVVQNVIPLNARREHLPRLALSARLPAASTAVMSAEAGFLLAHDYDRLAVARRGAWYVARILAGAEPGTLPFERPAAFVVAANRATLAHLGLSMPEQVALQVTQWIG
jgi:putative ABC transport system substrate-binding protein